MKEAPSWTSPDMKTQTGLLIFEVSAINTPKSPWLQALFSHLPESWECSRCPPAGEGGWGIAVTKVGDCGL